MIALPALLNDNSSWMNCNNYVKAIICSHFLFCLNLSWEVYLHWDSPLLVFSLSYLWFFSLEKWSNDHCVFLHNDENEKKLHDIERDIPNKWRWEWLETKVLMLLSSQNSIRLMNHCLYGIKRSYQEIRYSWNSHLHLMQCWQRVYARWSGYH